MKSTPKTLIMAVLFAVSAFMFVGKLLVPTPIQIIIQGEDPIIVGQLFRYTQFDVAIISISAIILAASCFYLLSTNSDNNQTVSPIIIEKNSASELDVTFALRLLDGDKRQIFNEIVDANGELLQSDLHAHTGFSKAKITRILDYLELKGLIVRKSFGMTNKIVINRNGHIEPKKEH
ncbi:MAG: hypothetical protein CW691_05975 [Candidatus Bathyarchaeum sp.]|nr:MAG: hypothetical protein CW691_05975 [Candidatus Bathyarchaeum sp.]